MPLADGTRLGVFEIVAPLGKGGMGEVYRARDTKLGRDVAVKILPEEMAERSERMARFEHKLKSELFPRPRQRGDGPCFRKLVRYHSAFACPYWA